jgi:hypothetical protein
VRSGLVQEAPVLARAQQRQQGVDGGAHVADDRQVDRRAPPSTSPRMSTWAILAWAG